MSLLRNIYVLTQCVNLKLITVCHDDMKCGLYKVIMRGQVLLEVGSDGKIRIHNQSSASDMSSTALLKLTWA